MMLTDFPLFPEQASTVAKDVDLLFGFLCVLTGSVSILVFFTIFFLAIKYRRTPTNELAQDYEVTHLLEFAWIIGPSIIFVFIFICGSWLYFHLARVLDDALDIYATGNQEMWTFDHPTAHRETTIPDT